MIITKATTKVTIYDELPGSGKSSRMIDKINESLNHKRYIVVTPFLDECHRYAGTYIDLDSGDRKLPQKDEHGNVIYNGTGCNTSGRQFHHPASGYENKVEHIARLVNQGKDIVTTHAALKMFTPNTLADIRDAGYTLIIDEELECIRPHPCKMHRRKMLLGSGAVYEDDMGLLRWNPDYNTGDETDDGDGTGYSWDMRIKFMCDNGSLVLIEDETGSRDLFMWEYPIDFIKAFDEVEVLTYLFEGSVFNKYLDFYGITQEIVRGVQLPINPFDLINVIDNAKMNRVGDREYALSATDQRRYTKDSATATTVRTNLTNYFNNKTYGKSETSDRLWTCLKESLKVFKGKGYTKNHIPCNTKAVNTYRDTYQLAYIHNVNMNPEPYKYLQQRGEQFAPDMDRYALSELLQWLYRSRVRCKHPVNLYIPSSRMRGMLVDWMSGYHTVLNKPLLMQ